MGCFKIWGRKDTARAPVFGFFAAFITGIFMSIVLASASPRRKELISLIESKGHKYIDVSKADYLVCEDPNGNSSKLQKARKSGIKLISYEEFMEKMK